jgi:hypothetical protein
MLSGQRSLYQGKIVKNMEIEQRHVIKFFTKEDIPEAEIIFRLRDYYKKDTPSRIQIYFGSAKESKEEPISILLQAPEESPMKVLLLLLLRRSMQTVISQREGSPSLWELRLQRSVRIGPKFWE